MTNDKRARGVRGERGERGEGEGEGVEVGLDDDLGLIFATIGVVHTHNVHQRSLYRKIYPA